MTERDLPSWIEKRRPHVRKVWAGWWRKPWTCPKDPSRARGFKEALWKHGHLSPNFSRAEAACQDGTAVPGRLRHRAQLLAFALERVRHDCGDRPLRPVSWYRSPSHNRAVGGVTNSRHLYADATDWSKQGAAFDRSARRHCRGIGTQTAGNYVRHADMGRRRTWSY